MEYEYTNEAIIEQNINPSNKDEGDYMLIADFKLNKISTLLLQHILSSIQP
jgi:hypothetical protein